MSAAGNADQVSKEVKDLRVKRRKYTLVLTWVIAYSVVFILFQHMLQVARVSSPYIGYEVPLPAISLYITSLSMLVGVVLTYIFRPGETFIKLVIATSVVFVVTHYAYIYTVLSSRSNELRIEVLPFLLKYVSSSGHESLAIDLGQLVLATVIIYLAARVKDIMKIR